MTAGLHAKLYVAEQGKHVIVWTGSANATDAAFQHNVEFLTEMVGARGKHGINELLRKSSDRDEMLFGNLLDEFNIDSELEKPDPDLKKLERKIREAKVAIASRCLTAVVVATPDPEWFRVRLRTGTPHPKKMPSGLQVRCWPITGPETKAQFYDCANSVAATFDRIHLLDITSFYAFEILARKGRKSLRHNFVMNVPLRNAPSARPDCRGISQAHGEKPPIIHRDIKPQNILVGYEADGLRARVSDFGLAKKVNPLTLLATAAGTLAFKPPEAFSQRKGDSPAADVWALGVTLYLLLMDQLPYQVDPDLGWSNKAAFEKDPPAPSSWNPEIDAGLEQIVLRCMEKNPAKRYQSAKALLDALDDWKRPATHHTSSSKRALSSEVSKSVLGAHSPADLEAAHRLVRTALKKAKDDGHLVEAADLMEEAFNKSPSLRAKYADQVRLWRCGISM